LIPTRTFTNHTSILHIITLHSATTLHTSTLSHLHFTTSHFTLLTTTYAATLAIYSYLWHSTATHTLILIATFFTLHFTLHTSHSLHSSLIYIFIYNFHTYTLTSHTHTHTPHLTVYTSLPLTLHTPYIIILTLHTLLTFTFSTLYILTLHIHLHLHFIIS
jgi:hypothetical protein